MDLVASAEKSLLRMMHVNKAGQSKILKSVAINWCVKKVTELAVRSNTQRV
jgi:3-oxoacid CoA-transferase subunit B